jgi:hypothetical protein
MDEHTPDEALPVDVVHLIVPPYSTHLELVRAAASHVADCAGLGADDRDDLCLAVDELCQLVVAATDFAIVVTFTAQPSTVLARVVGRRRHGSQFTRVSGVTEAVLARAVDFFSLDPGDEAVEGIVVKRRAGTRRA